MKYHKAYFRVEALWGASPGNPSGSMRALSSFSELANLKLQRNMSWIKQSPSQYIYFQQCLQTMSESVCESRFKVVARFITIANAQPRRILSRRRAREHRHGVLPATTQTNAKPLRHLFLWSRCAACVSIVLGMLSWFLGPCRATVALCLLAFRN
jgi:hypothetical protein